EFNGSRLTTAVGAVRRDNVPGIAENEEVSRLRLREQSRIDAGIRAGNEQCLGLLCLCQLFEQPLERPERVLLELVNTADQLLHEAIFLFSLVRVRASLVGVRATARANRRDWRTITDPARLGAGQASAGSHRVAKVIICRVTTPQVRYRGLRPDR